MEDRISIVKMDNIMDNGRPVAAGISIALCCLCSRGISDINTISEDKTETFSLVTEWKLDINIVTASTVHFIHNIISGGRSMYH